MNIIFTVSGGMGKCIAATAVCRAIRKAHPNSTIIVVSGYPEVFQSNPNVDFSYGYGQEQYFYSKYVEGSDVEVMAQEPYMDTAHIAKREHLVETWCRLCKVPFDGEAPEININERELQFFSRKYSFEKPIMVLQTNGGANNQEVKYSWARDVPAGLVNAVIEEYRGAYTICHVRREDQPAYEHTVPIHESMKGISVLLAISRKRLLMDSFCQHAAAALHARSTVLWIVNSPRVFGYNVHDNIPANPENAKPDLKFSYLSKYNIVGAPGEFPYVSERDIFNLDSILGSLAAQR